MSKQREEIKSLVKNIRNGDLKSAQGNLKTIVQEKYNIRKKNMENQ